MPSDSDRSSTTPILEAISRALEMGGAAALATLIEAHQDVGAKFLLTNEGTLVSNLGVPEIEEAIRRQAVTFLASNQTTRTFAFGEFAPELPAWSNARILFERVELEPRLIVCGGGHVGAALAHLAALIGYRVTIIDDRAEFVTAADFPEDTVAPVLADGWSDTLRAGIGTGRGVSIAIVTRGHKQDEECLRAALANAADYVGLIGSKRRTRFVLQKLREEGFAADKLEQVRAPIGLDIGAVSPEEVALAILAEIVANRRSGTGAPLSRLNRSR
jgi:xanthine dehydrogenase accessory factor